jgi:electron transport complex protein RnfB
VASVEEIDALLPQTQCTRCGYAGCRPYAEAIVRGTAGINQCPPGGTTTIAALAARLGREPLPRDPAFGTQRPHEIAVIDESRCIGCAKCLPPCPVDAIVGASKHLHTVIAELCTGCALCIAPCPVDCIVLVPAATLARAPRAPAREDNRARYETHRARLARRQHEDSRWHESRKQDAHGSGAPA